MQNTVEIVFLSFGDLASSVSSLLCHNLKSETVSVFSQIPILFYKELKLNPVIFCFQADCITFFVANLRINYIFKQSYRAQCYDNMHL